MYYSLDALDRAHRYVHKILYLLCFVFIMTSWSRFSIVHSASLSLPLNVSLSSVSSRSNNTTTVDSIVDLQVLPTQISLLESYPKNNTNVVTELVKDVPSSTTLSVIVPNALPDSSEHQAPFLGQEDNLLDYNIAFRPFLLMCFVKSIRYWSPKCALHSSNELLSHRSTINNLRNGFSGMSVHKDVNTNSTQLVWFDVEKYEFHLARFAIRSNVSQCDNPLTFSYEVTLDYSSNPRASDYLEYNEKMVKITSSNNHLMVANYLLNRIDIYRFNQSDNQSIKLSFIESIYTVRPSVIVFHSNNLLWLENGSRICRYKYFFNNQQKSKQTECHETKNETILAFTVLKNKQILYSTKTHGHLYQLDWNNFNAQFLGSVDLPQIISMTSMDSNIIYFSENDGQVHRLNISNGFHDFEAVSIESTTIFDIIFMDNNIFEQQSEMTTINSYNFNNVDDNDDYEPVILINHDPQTMILIIFIFSLVTFILWCLVIIFRKPLIRQRLTTIHTKFPNACGFIQSIRPYAQMCQARAASISEVLIEDEEDDNLSNYRQNITSHRPIAANDIEDLLGNRTTMQNAARCIACRDPGICQDKGLCMATYKTQQQ